MNATSEVLRAESKRLRSLAERLDALAEELDGKAPPGVLSIHRPTFYGGGEAMPIPEVVKGGRFGEFAGMTQHASILKALELYGPQTTRELFNRLNAGGMSFKKPVYITAVLGRLKDLIERDQSNRVALKKPAGADKR